MKLFVPGMTGGIASCPSLIREGGKVTIEENDIYHIYCSLIPVKYFNKLTGKKEKRKNTYKWEDNLPVLILEGTNYSHATIAPIFTYTGKKIFNRTEQIRKNIENKFPGLKELNIHAQQENYQAESVYDISEEEISHFYRRVLSFWTHDYQILDWSVGYGNQTKGTKDNGYGVDFRDFISKSEKITFLPTFELEEYEFDIILESLDKELPVRIDAITQLTDISFSQNNPLSQIISQRNGFSLKIQKQEKTPIFPNFISYKLNHINKLTPTLLEDLRNCSKQYHIDYHIFPITKDEELYLIDIRVYV